MVRTISRNVVGEMKVKGNGEDITDSKVTKTRSNKQRGAKIEI